MRGGSVRGPERPWISWLGSLFSKDYDQDSRLRNQSCVTLLHGVFQEAGGPVKICRSGRETGLKNALNIL